MVGIRTSAHPRLHGGGQPTVVSHGKSKPCYLHAAGIHRLPDSLVNTTIPPTFCFPYLILVPDLFFLTFSTARSPLRAMAIAPHDPRISH